MTVLGDYTNCSTSGLRNLDLQLIAQMNKICPGVLVSFQHLPITIGAGCHAYLQAPAVKALEKAIASRLGHQMVCNSAYRTLAQQAVLYNHYKHKRCGIVAAALPGKSNHNTGLSLDIEDAQGWKPYLEAHGWDWIGSFDPMHFDYEGGGTKDLRHLAILSFQQLWNINYPKKQLDEDGQFGQKTMDALLSTSLSGFIIAPSIPQITPVNKPSKPIVSLRMGSEGKSVRILQEVLTKRGYKVAIDGDFGKATEDAVKKFQLASKLAVDGCVGSGTATALGIS